MAQIESMTRMDQTKTSLADREMLLLHIFMSIKDASKATHIK